MKSYRYASVYTGTCMCLRVPPSGSSWSWGLKSAPSQCRQPRFAENISIFECIQHSISFNLTMSSVPSSEAWTELSQPSEGGVAGGGVHSNLRPTTKQPHF